MADFFSSWTFIILMAVVLLVLGGLCVGLAVTALVIVLRNKRQDRP